MQKTKKNRVKIPKWLIAVCFIAAIIINYAIDHHANTNIEIQESIQETTEQTTETPEEVNTEEIVTGNTLTEEQTSIYTFSVPEDNGNTYAVLNNNVPLFSDEDKTRTDAFEIYSDLDSFGRCGVAYANICKELMPTEERGEIGMVKPTGWHTVKYDCVDGKYLYNRCHLIAFCLAGENANEKNLITGTRYFNVEGMLPFEEEVADYVDRTGNHVLYRVTPIFEGNNLVASGVTMEAYSVEDNGAGICFYVYVYNKQPGVSINYATGESSTTRH